MPLKIVSLVLCCLFVACVPLKKEADVSKKLELAKAVRENPLSPEESEALLKDVAGNWFYGQGIGNSALQLGAVLIFPPYAVLALGNLILNMSGYESIGLGSVLPEEEKKNWNEFYDSIASGPGRFTSALAGEEFVTREMASTKLTQYFQERGSVNAEENKLQIPNNVQ